MGSVSGSILLLLLPNLGAENLVSLRAVSAAGVCSPRRAESRFLPQEGGMDTLSWGVNGGIAGMGRGVAEEWPRV